MIFQEYLAFIGLIYTGGMLYSIASNLKHFLVHKEWLKEERDILIITLKENNNELKLQLQKKEEQLEKLQNLITESI